MQVCQQRPDRRGAIGLTHEYGTKLILDRVGGWICGRRLSDGEQSDASPPYYYAARTQGSASRGGCVIEV
jgi:hypothetical protein